MHAAVRPGRQAVPGLGSRQGPGVLRRAAPAGSAPDAPATRPFTPAARAAMRTPSGAAAARPASRPNGPPPCSPSPEQGSTRSCNRSATPTWPAQGTDHPVLVRPPHRLLPSMAAGETALRTYPYGARRCDTRVVSTTVHDSGSMTASSSARRSPQPFSTRAGVLPARWSCTH